MPAVSEMLWTLLHYTNENTKGNIYKKIMYSSLYVCIFKKKRKEKRSINPCGKFNKMTLAWPVCLSINSLQIKFFPFFNLLARYFCPFVLESLRCRSSSFIAGCLWNELLLITRCYILCSTYMTSPVLEGNLANTSNRPSSHAYKSTLLLNFLF